MSYPKSHLFIITLVTLICVPLMAKEANVGPSPAKNLADFAIKIGGFIQWDYDYFNGLYNANETGSESKLRRARLFFKGKLPDDFSYMLMSNYNTKQKEVELLNAFIRYSGMEAFDVTVGRFKEPFGMEALSSALWTSTIERSLITNKPQALQAGLFIDSGIMLSKFRRKSSWSIALVNDGLEDENGKELYGLSGRFTYAPIVNDASVLHFGVAHAARQLEEGTQLTIKEPLSVATANKVTLFDQPIDDFSQSAIELAFRHRGLTVQSEYFLTRIEESTQTLTRDLHSYYGVISYVLSGESRQYQRGLFGSLAPSGKRAMELVAKYENNVLRSAGGEDITAEVSTLGINIYCNQYVKLAVNYVHAKTDNLELFDTGEALTARMQLHF